MRMLRYRNKKNTDVLYVDPKPPNLAAKLNIFSINRKAAGKIG